MNKIGKIIITSATCCLMLASCGGKGSNDPVKDFGQKVAGYASANQLDSLKAIYPDAAKADSVALTFTADSIKVESTDKPNVYKVIYNSNASVLVNVDPENNKASVIESTGLFAFPDSVINFAKQTGMLTEALNDVKTAERLAQVPAIKAFIYNEYAKSRTGGLKVGKFVMTYEPQFGMEQGHGYYPITNTTDQDIQPGEYTLEWLDEWGYMNNQGSKRRTESGKQAIPAGGTIKIDNIFTWHESSDLKSATLKSKPEKEFWSTYQAKGDEYTRFNQKSTE